MPDSTWDMIDNHVTNVMQPFYARVDKRRKRLNQTPYKMIDPLSKAAMDDVIIVTENRSSSYMKRVIAGLMSAKWQGVVEGEISTREAHKIEKFNEASFQQADEYLMQKYGKPGLDVWLDNHACHTCLLGVQWMADVTDEGEYKIHCRPCDMRWTPFVLNKWVAPILTYSKDDLLAELEEYEKLGKDDPSNNEYSLTADTLKDTDNELRDYWSEKENEIWINEKFVFKQKNTYRKLPFVIMWVPSGYYFEGKVDLQYASPSLLDINEGMYEQLSRQLSIDATLGYDVLNPATEYETETPTGLLSRPRPKRGEDKAVPKGERHVVIPTADINRAELASRDQTTSLIENANPLSPRSYQTPPSAIEITTEVELLDQLMNPQIIALEAIKASIARLNIEQVMLLGEGKQSILAGRTGRRSNFSITDLKDPKKYAINYQLMKQSKRLALVNEARALAAMGSFPKKYIFSDIMAVEDPDGWMREMELEKAKEANPAIGLAEMAVRYAEEAEDMEGDDKDLKNWQSMMLTHDYVMLMRQRMQPALPEETQNLREATKETGNRQGLISLLGQRR